MVTSEASLPFDLENPGDDIDIITFNIDDDLIAHNDDILFGNDHQFDLASYIGGESTTLLLSPVIDVTAARRRLISGHLENKTLARDLSQIPANAAHDKVDKTPASNRRKRKNLSREFIESNDSDDNETPTKTIENHTNDDSKRNKRIDTDPVWCPPADKRNSPPSRMNEITAKESSDLKKDIKIGHGQGKGLRDMLKQQMLSDRPMIKSKLMKNLSSSLKTAEKVAVNVAPVKRMGVGRGKDIAITAKYYNCNESSDISERDKVYKHDRYHQIYTESEDSDDDVDSEPIVSSKVNKKQISVEIDSGKERRQSVEKKQNTIEIQKCETIEKCVSKSKIETKTNGESKKPIFNDSRSMDSTDFAKALITNTKIVPKSKSTPASAKKNILEQQKRLIQSNLLLQNPAKFSLFSSSKTQSLNRSLSAGEIKTANIAIEQKSEPNKVGHELNRNVDKTPIGKSVKNESTQEVIHESPDSKPDAIFVDEIKVESNAKRKLNVQEYLKRKNLKGSNNDNIGLKDNLIVDIKTEQTEEQSVQGNAAEDDAQCNFLAGNSMYEEIIIVSMGCNTDISIPEASFIQPSEIKDSESDKSTVLLSDIQTSVEKANSKISCCSLISSIQDVILKKSHCIDNGKKEVKAGDGDVSAKGAEKPEHGENKVIMHLRKDRVRTTRVSTCVQTDSYFQFPPLEKLVPLSKKLSMSSEKRTTSIPRDRSNDMHCVVDSKNKIRSYRSRLSESSYYSDEEVKLQRPSRHSEFMDRQNGRRRKRRESSRYSSSRYLSRHRTISRSLSSSSDNSTTSSGSSSSSQSSSSSSSYVSSASVRSLNSYGGSSSKSYYGDDHQYYQRGTSNNSRRSNFRPISSMRSKSPEERRIVYVGRIEEETTKEELRRKFSVYGQVKQVSLHQKETKMKYGFVTFIQPRDAYNAIDDSPKNPAIRHYDISFGGRRAFCGEKYLDLDNLGRNRKEAIVVTKPPIDDGDSFDALLRKMKEKIQKDSKK